MTLPFAITRVYRHAIMFLAVGTTPVWISRNDLSAGRKPHKRWRTCLITVALTLCSSVSVFAGSEDGATLQTPLSGETHLYKKSYALLVGVSQYTNGWDSLEQIPYELEAARQALMEHGFEVTLELEKTSSSEIQDVYQNFIDQYGYDQNNRLLFIFSGHGHTWESGNQGYLVPSDAPLPATAEGHPGAPFLRSVLHVSQMVEWSRQMTVRHAMFLFDSCFSGTVFKSRAQPNVRRFDLQNASQTVRQFITAGSASELVPARSVFMPAFVNAISNGAADLYEDGYVTGTELGLFLQSEVSQHAAQTPQFGKHPSYHLAQGEFLFVVDTDRSRAVSLAGSALDQSEGNGQMASLTADPESTPQALIIDAPGFTGKPRMLTEPMDHLAPVRSAGFSGDESHIITATDDNQLHLWNAQTGDHHSSVQLDSELAGIRKNPVKPLQVLAWTGDHQMLIWNPDSERPLDSVNRSQQRRTSADGGGVSISGNVSIDGNVSIAGDVSIGDGVSIGEGVRIGAGVSVSTGASGKYFSDGSRLITRDSKGLIIRDASTGKITASMSHRRLIGASMSQDETRVVSWSRQMKVWDAVTGKPTGGNGLTRFRHRGRILGASFYSDNSRIMSWSEDGSVRLWDTHSGKLAVPALSHEDELSGAIVNADDSRIASWIISKKLYLWHGGTGEPIGGPLLHEGVVFDVKFDPSGRRLLSRSSGPGTVRIWDSNLKQYSPGSNRVYVWDAIAGRAYAAPLIHAGVVRGAIFSDDGTRILSWADDGVVKLWDAETADLIFDLSHNSAILGARFDESDTQLLSWSEDGAVKLWDARNGRQIGDAMRHDGAVSGATFNRDGTRVLSWSSDGSVRLWAADGVNN